MLKTNETIQRIHEKMGIPIPDIERALRDAQGDWNVAMALLESPRKRVLACFGWLVMPIAVYWITKLAAWLLLRVIFAVSQYPTRPMSPARILQTPFDLFCLAAMGVFQSDNPAEVVSGGSTVLAVLAAILATVVTVMVLWDMWATSRKVNDVRNGGKQA
jgi:hypothetical protein